MHNARLSNIQFLSALRDRDTRKAGTQNIERKLSKEIHGNCNEPMVS